MGVKLDKIEGNTAVKTFYGWEVTRIVQVHEPTGTASEKIKNAVESTTGVPSIGEAHPTFTSSWCKSIIPVLIDANLVELTCLYVPGEYPVGEYDIGATSSQIDTNMDVAGNDVYVTYTYPNDYIEESYQGLTDVQGATFSKFVPEIVFTIRKWESISKSSLLTKIKTYQNKVNTAGWNLDSSAIEGSWLCSEIRGRSNPTSGGYDVTYTFRYRPPFVRGATTYAGWKETVIYIDPNTGKPPPPATWAAGTIAFVTNYEAVDFDGLSL